jgi:hypothetical protein
MLPTPYVASLRIYEPLSSFPPVDQSLWSSIPMETYSSREEQLCALRRTILSESPSFKSDGAHVIDQNGKRFVSPWSTARRCLVAVEDFKNSLPASITHFFLPEDLTGTLSASNYDLENRVSHIISETWMIPPRWFSLFTPQERLRGKNTDGPFTIMRTEISQAKIRCMTTHKIVQQAFGFGPVEVEIAQLLNWLNIFHPESIVECDYGGLALYLEKALNDDGEPGLDADRSIEDVTLSLQGLSNGDGAMAGNNYENLVTRWRKVAALEQAM